CYRDWSSDVCSSDLRTMQRACPKFTATLAALATFVVASVVYAQGTWTPLAPVIPLPTEGMTVGGVGQVIIAAYGLSATDTNLTRSEERRVGKGRRSR